MWFAVYIEGFISSSKLRDGLGLATFVISSRLLFSAKEEPKMYPIWHQMLKIASSSGTPPQTQLRSLRRSLTILVAFTQLAITAWGLSCMQLRHSDVKVCFLACSPWLRGSQEEFL